MSITPEQSATSAPCEQTLRRARARWDGETLTLDTGRVARRWRWTPTGFATIGLRRAEGRELIEQPATTGDLRLPGGLSIEGAELLGVKLGPDDDEGFVPEHLLARLRVRYPAANCLVELRHRAYVDAPGLHAQAAVRLEREFDDAPAIDETMAVTAESLPIACRGATCTAAGYYNQTQQRNHLDTPLLREQRVPDDGVCDWASLLRVERDGEGCLLVKESHKCVNQPGYDGGAFLLDATGLRSSGWGLRRGDLRTDAWRTGWAHWTLAYAATDDHAAARSLRAFLAQRYPHDPARDEVVVSNTWGSSFTARDARDAAREDNVLREMAIAVELGVDVVQIDDGWQLPYSGPAWEPGGQGPLGWHPEDNRWRPHPHPYPEGWGRIRARAAELGVGLGLWAAGEPISLADLQHNAEAGGFRHFKLDFMVLDDHERIAALREKARRFIRDAGHRHRINWDVTENAPRVGYFWLRECGCLYLANRKPHCPESTRYRPHTVLRDAWQLARYQRLQDVQLTMQNPDKVAREDTDAWRHSAAYCLAITLMGTPILFQQLQFLLPEARRQVRELLAVYKPHRARIYAGDVAPIGEAPSNASHTGFHCRVGDSEGYLLIFREIGNAEATARFRIPGLAGSTLAFDDLVSGERGHAAVDAGGDLDLRIEAAPGFRFLRYRCD